MAEQHLFTDEELAIQLRGFLAQLKHDIDALDADQLDASTDDQIIEHFYNPIEPITLHDDHKQMVMNEVMIPPRGGPGARYHLIHGIEARISIPFSGALGLWRSIPAKTALEHPRAEIQAPAGERPGEIHVSITVPLDDAGEIEGRLDDILGLIRFYLDAQSEQLEAYNGLLRKALGDFVQARRARLEVHKAVQQKLNIPLKRRGDVPAPIPMKRRLQRPALPAKGAKPEWGIPQGEYDYILSVIRHEGRSMEATPKTYADHEEEELRDMLRAHLNGHYQGDAAGEAFRRKGKTDILIEFDNRAGFVAECKIWRGPKSLTEALDQLLGYLTWRDCKAALVFFNTQNAKFSDVRDRALEALNAHPGIKAKGKPTGEGEWQATVAHANDEGHLITVHLFVFNLFV